MSFKPEQEDQGELVAKLDALVPGFLEYNRRMLVGRSLVDLEIAEGMKNDLRRSGFVGLVELGESMLGEDFYALGALEFKTEIEGAEIVRVHDALGIG